MLLQILDEFDLNFPITLLHSAESRLAAYVSLGENIGEFIYVQGKGVRFYSGPYDTLYLSGLRANLSRLCSVFDSFEPEVDESLPMFERLAQVLGVEVETPEGLVARTTGGQIAKFTFLGYEFEAKTHGDLLSIRSLDFIPVHESNLGGWSRSLERILIGYGKSGNWTLHHYAFDFSEDPEEYAEDRWNELEEEIAALKPSEVDLERLLAVLHTTVPIEHQAALWAAYSKR